MRVAGYLACGIVRANKCRLHTTSTRDDGTEHLQEGLERYTGTQNSKQLLRGVLIRQRGSVETAVTLPGGGDVFMKLLHTSQIIAFRNPKLF